MKLQTVKDNNPVFFSRGTMKFFGDTMNSFGLRLFNGDYVLYRKPNVMVDVFGTWKRAGKENSRAWYVNCDGTINRVLGSDEFEAFYDTLPSSVK